ncbi:MAG: ABC transporter permease [Betaproteobacteria bacterium]|nr:ABC transporter permease [Betaproteobacteria bacterium]
MLRLEARPIPSTLMGYAAPVIALLATVVFGSILFATLGKNPVAGLTVFFITPLETVRGLTEVGLKMVPLLLCALGLALCYRSNVWNIGAEGQLVVGGIVAGGVALLASPASIPGYFLLVLLAGMAGGMAWAAITAWLRDSFNANEILVSLMLSYVGGLLLLYLVNGPWKDPKGFNFPYSKTFDAVAMVPKLVPGTRLTWGIVIAFLALVVIWIFVARSKAGFRLQVAGHAPLAARFAGFSAREGIWMSLLICGALAGLAGALEVAGPLGQLTPQFSSGYGFAAIIVAWLGRLHPGGCVFAAFVMALIYIGGELSQSRLGLPAAITGVFQGMLLLSLLTADTFIHYRLRRV